MWHGNEGNEHIILEQTGHVIIPIVITCSYPKKQLFNQSTESTDK